MANTKIPSELSSTPSISDSGDATAITITSDENVGIGTASPNQDGFDANATVLSVKSANNGEGVLELIGGGNNSGDTIGVLNFMSQSAVSPATQIVTERWTADDEGSMVFKTSSGERMRIPANNKHLYIGFSGTEAPSTVLDGTGGAGCVYIGNSSDSFPVVALESTHSKWLADYISSDGALQSYNSVTDRLTQKTTANGEVTFPYQPAFDVSDSGGTSQGNTKTFGTVYVNKGSHYSTSNGRFTAPIAGTYLFYMSYIKNGSLSVHRRGFIKNGSTTDLFPNGRQLRLDADSSGGQQYGDNGYLIMMTTLAANDYIQVYQSAGNSYGAHEYEVFGGYLIG